MDDADLTPLEHAYLSIMRIRNAISAAALFAASIGLEFAVDLVTGLFVIPAFLFLLAWVLLIPRRQFRRKGYDMGADRLRVVSGYLFHSDTVVPFGRVQHIDVLQGPLERMFGLATLVLRTAGTHNASVVLHGLKHETAVTMRETIRKHIKRELS